jgi:hypothetical protein
MTNAADYSEMSVASSGNAGLAGFLLQLDPITQSPETIASTKGI